MEALLPKDIQAGLDAARRAMARKTSRLGLEVDGIRYPVLRMWKTGFAVIAEDVPQIRGLVDIYDGSSHLFQCLIIASEREAGEMHFGFKRATAVAALAPLDFVKAADAPVALISDGRQI